MKLNFSRPKTRISTDMYENSKVIMWMLRLIGLFPLEVEKNKKSELYLKLSFFYMFYSCALGIFILSTAYYDQYQHLFSNKEKPMHTVTKTDKFVRYAGMNASCLMIFCEIFTTPSKLSNFFQYLKCITDVNVVIKRTYKRYEKYPSILLLSLLLTQGICTDVLDVYMGLVVGKKNLFELIKTNIIYHLLYKIIVAIAFSNHYMASSLEKRILGVNKILNLQYLNIKNARLVKTGSSTKKNSTNKKMPLPPPVPSIEEIHKVYLKLMDAAENLNSIFGINNVLAIVAAHFQLVACEYFIILILKGKVENGMQLTLWILISSIQIFKLLLFIEPWYACSQQTENTKNLICKLLSSGNTNDSDKKQVRAFLVTFCLRNYEFSAGGFFVVNRFLYTALLANITNFVVISLQAQESDVQ